MSNEDNIQGIEHLDHCIDTLRQSLMVIFLLWNWFSTTNIEQCNADITPLTFAREKKGGPGKAVADVLHNCQSFEDVQRWAWDRRFHTGVNLTVAVTDDPLGWGNYIYTS